MPALTAQVTFTGQLGAGVTVTSKLFTGVTKLTLDFDAGVAGIYQGSEQCVYVELTNSATLTDTITSGNHVIAIST